MIVEYIELQSGAAPMQVDPEPKAQLCPVCDGLGKIHRKQSKIPGTCHGCDGKGWVRT